MGVVNGSKKSDVLNGHDGDDTIYGNQGDDLIAGATAPGHSNVLVGGAGNDVLHAGNGGDVLIGDGPQVRAVNPGQITIANDVVAHVAFEGSHAGFHNTVGMYVYDDKGIVTDVKILYANVSGAGVSDGPGSLDVPLKAGEHIGFFVAPNAFDNSDHALFSRTDGRFEMFDATTGGPANVNSGHEMQIAFHDNNNQWTLLKTQYGATIFTTNTNDNYDGFQHAKTTVDALTGKLSVAFEDLINGGDQNFMDANFSLTIGTQNVRAIGHHDSVSQHAPNNDTLIGGDGNDTLLGVSGDDTLNGGLGDNIVNGGSGNDHIIAGGGNDTITGGSGFDTLDFSGAKHGVKVDLEAHTASGFGNDKVSGVEAVIGSTFADLLTGDKADNLLFGAAGNDVLRGGRGSDTLTGGDGDDTFLFLKKDVLDTKGNSQGVDHITDFGNGHDVLDLTDLFHGVKGSHDGLVTTVDTKAGTEVYASLGGHQVQVAVLDNVHTSAADLMHAGLLLA